MKDEIMLPEGYEPGMDLFAEAGAETPPAAPETEQTHAEQTKAAAKQSVAVSEAAGREDAADRLGRPQEAAAYRAPVRGVTGGGAAAPEEGRSPFELGFDAASFR